MAGESEMRNGCCLCEAVRFKARLKDTKAGACHCSMCRRWSGGVFIAVECSEIAFESEDALGVYQSSDYGERVFCKTCGSTLLWRMQDGSAHAVSVQALEDQSGVSLASEIFIDEKPGFYAFANATKKTTGAEFFAAYVGGSA